MSMKNSKKYAKSRGILAFAHNTNTTDYVAIATQTLEIASQVLELPYTLITEVDDNKFINSRYDIDTNTFVQWRNYGRHLAYNLTPYEETLVIDADYIVLDKNLLSIFEASWDYLLQRQSHALTTTWPESMGTNSLPYVWATVFAFRKTNLAEEFFKLVDRIHSNYSYYSALFNIRERNYRNDYAFAIADIILNGYVLDNKSIPGSMLAVDQPIESIEINTNQLIIRDQTQAYVVPKTNLHIMSKSYLQSHDFLKFKTQILNEST